MLDWGDLAKTVVGLGAPLVGEALGGPFGATAGKILAQAFNAPEPTPAAVREAISTSDPALAAAAAGNVPRSLAAIRCSAGGDRFMRSSSRWSSVRPSA
jgi:hypothetical protein